MYGAGGLTRDETVIGDSVAVPLVIGERRKSGGDSNNFVHTRQARLGCFIPFSMLDGTTPLPRFLSSGMRMFKKMELLSGFWPQSKRKGIVVIHTGFTFPVEQAALTKLCSIISSSCLQSGGGALKMLLSEHKLRKPGFEHIRTVSSAFSPFLCRFFMLRLFQKVSE